MKLPAPPESTRFFARVESSWLACPRCGLVMYFSTTAHRAINCRWDPRTARLKCGYSASKGLEVAAEGRGCGLTFAVGLLLWPVAKRPGLPNTIPLDQVPVERELAQMRAMEGIGRGSGAGHWMTEPRKGWREPHTNVTTECTCKAKHGALGDVECPLHGVPDYEGKDPWPR